MKRAYKKAFSEEFVKEIEQRLDAEELRIVEKRRKTGEEAEEEEEDQRRLVKEEFFDDGDHKDFQAHKRN